MRILTMVMSLLSTTERSPEQFQKLLTQYDAASEAAKMSLAAALDAAAGQKDAATSRLFWFTDFAQAQAVAKATGKPILSLRMLGNLTDELSCANSRFFRTLLYPDPAINSQLRSDFVLHWSSERPAPRITIDFGDGRVVTRTVTGNSMHVLFDASGQVLDAMPGLVDPANFAEWLRRAPRNEAAMKVHHTRVVANANAVFKSIGASRPVRIESKSKAPPARVAVKIAATKMLVQAPMVRAFTPEKPAQPEAWQPEWDELKERFSVQLSREAVAAVRAKNPMDWSSGRAAPLSPGAFDSMVYEFQESIALDTAKNLFVLQPAISEWLLTSKTRSFEALNTWVYSNLFMTPKDDPWLGLVPAGVFSALANDGIEVRTPVNNSK